MLSLDNSVVNGLNTTAVVPKNVVGKLGALHAEGGEAVPQLQHPR